MLNIQRREPDPQELIAVARRYGTVMVARAYADWSRQPEPFKGSLTAAMIDRVDCPAKQRDRIRMGTVHYTSGNPPTGGLGSSMVVSEQGAPSPYQRQWPTGPLSNSGPLPAIQAQSGGNEWPAYQDSPEPGHSEIDGNLLSEEETLTEEGYQMPEYQQRDPSRQPASYQYQSAPTGPLGSSSSTGPLGYPVQSTGNTGHMPAINASGSSTIVQSTVTQSTVDLNMLMDIIETVFVVGIPGTVSRDLISSANQFVPLVPGGSPAGQMGESGYGSMSATGNTGGMPAISLGASATQYQPYPMDVLDPQFLQFLDYIDRNWSWRTIIGVSNFIGDPVNPKNRFRGRLTRESARELLNTCIQQGILLVQTDATGAEDLRLNRGHPGVDEVLKQFVR